VDELREELREGFAKMAHELDDLEVTVTNAEGAMDSATALIEGFNAKLNEAIAANDMPRVKRLNDALAARTAAFAAAIVANPLPSDPPPVEPPPTEPPV
jgi:predicted RNA-binding Zn ribbon-like protein